VVASGGLRIAWKAQEQSDPRQQGHDPQETGFGSERAPRPHRRPVLLDAQEARGLAVSADGKAEHRPLEEVPRHVQADGGGQPSAAQARRGQQQSGHEDANRAQHAGVGVGQVQQGENRRGDDHAPGRAQAVGDVAQQGAARDQFLVDADAQVLGHREPKREAQGHRGVGDQEAAHLDPAQRQLDGEDGRHEYRPQAEAEGQAPPPARIEAHAVGVPASPVEPAASQRHAADHGQREQRAHDHVDGVVVGLGGQVCKEQAPALQRGEWLRHEQDGQEPQDQDEQRLAEQAPEGPHPPLAAVPEDPLQRGSGQV
jgi:hypothetical protein